MEGPTVAVVELAAETAGSYVRLAFEQMVRVAERLGDELVNERPIGPETNAPTEICRTGLIVPVAFTTATMSPSVTDAVRHLGRLRTWM